MDTREYGSMPGVLDTNTRIEGRGRVLRSHSFSGHETNSLFINENGTAFSDWSGLSQADSISDGRGFAYLDYDRDGWVDIALVNSNAPQLELFRNRLGDMGAQGRSIRIRLVGAQTQATPATDAGSPRDGVGAHVVVRAGGLTQRREARLGDGFAVQNSSVLHIGIGTQDAADEVIVHWPSGRESSVGRISAGAFLTVREPASDNPGGVVVERLDRAAIPAIVLPPLALDRWESPLPAPDVRLRVITTMATWCQVCRGELPHLTNLRAALPESEVKIFGFPIDVEDSVQALAAYRDEHHPAYTLWDGTTAEEKESMKQRLIKHLGDAAPPSSVIVDARGNIVRIRKGVPTLSEMRRLLKQVP